MLENVRKGRLGKFDGCFAAWRSRNQLNLTFSYDFGPERAKLAKDPRDLWRLLTFGRTLPPYILHPNTPGQ